MSRDTNEAADPTAIPTPRSGAPDLSYLHPDHLRFGGTGVFAGDWAWTEPASGEPRIPVGFVGVLIDTWNGWAVFRCTRQVAEAVVADQQRLRDAERIRLAAQGLDSDQLTARLDEAIAPMWFDGDEIVVDERVAYGETDGLSRVAPDAEGRYVVNGWRWTWTAVDPAACDRIAGQIPPPSQHQEYVILTHTGLRVPHDRLRVSSVKQMATHNGEAFVAALRLDGKRVGTIENGGDGGPTELYSANSAFGWERMRTYVEGCRRRGEPVSEEAVLDTLVDEFVTARRIATCARAGRCALRLMEPLGAGPDFDGEYYTVGEADAAAVTSDAQRTALAGQVQRQMPPGDGQWWQIWTGRRWEDLTPRPATGSRPDGAGQ